MRDTGVRLSSSRSLFYPIRREADNDGLRRTFEFSRRERAAATVSKSERSCARSGRLQRWVRRAGPSFRVAASPRAPPQHGTTRHDGRSAEPHQHAITRGTTGVRLEPPAAHDHARHHGQSAPRAVVPRLHDGHRHDGRSNHACTTRFPHHGRSYHASTTRTCTTESGTTGVRESRPMPRKRCADHAATAAERVGIQLPQALHRIPFEKQRSRARSGLLQCRVGPRHGGCIICQRDLRFQSVP